MTTFDRTAYRARRAALARSVRRDAAVAVAHWGRTVPEIDHGHRIGVYAPVGGELDPWLFVLAARNRGASVYLPDVEGAQLRASATLAFVEHQSAQTLVPGVYDIPVPPAGAPRIAPSELDVVLVPLVAFDGRGTRAGMGAGFYDRTFAFRANMQPPPLLVGLAYAWQRVAHLEPDPWDIALDLVITELGVLRVRPMTIS